MTICAQLRPPGPIQNRTSALRSHWCLAERRSLDLDHYESDGDWGNLLATSLTPCRYHFTSVNCWQSLYSSIAISWRPLYAASTAAPFPFTCHDVLVDKRVWQTRSIFKLTKSYGLLYPLCKHVNVSYLFPKHPDCRALQRSYKVSSRACQYFLCSYVFLKLGQRTKVLT